MSVIHSRLFLQETRVGSPTIRVVCDDGSVKAIHSMYDPESEARVIVNAFQYEGKGLLVILGLGFGYHVVELIKKFPEANIVVVESMQEIYELAKTHGRIPEIEDKVKIFAGLTQDEIISEITAIQIKLGFPPLGVFTLSSAFSAHNQYYQPIYDSLKNTTSLKLWDKLRYKKFKEDELNIALIDFNYFLNIEVERAIKGLGHNVLKVRGNKEESASDVLRRMVKSIVEFKPDFIITINHLGFDEGGILTNLIDSIEMPVASWYVDSPNVIVRSFKKNVSPYVSVFLWDKEYINDIKDMGFESVKYLPLATDEDVFKPEKLRLNETKRYGTYVGFVGNSMVISAREKIEKVPEPLHTLVYKMANYLSVTRKSFRDAVNAMDGEYSDKVKYLTDQERTELEAAILWRATLLYRLSCIENLSDYNPRIHGDDGWKEILNNCYDIGPHLNYYTELPLFYNACRINFNATHLQMTQAVNQRVFDIPSCSSFILTDYQESLNDLFEIGKEVVTYKNKDEIPELVKYYLNRPGDRMSIAAKARERVLKEHTYKHRLNSIIHTMKKRYK